MSNIFEKRIKSMSAKEIILTMVESLRNPVTEINMDTYGRAVLKHTGEIVCYGCAATNTILKLIEIENQAELIKELELRPIVEKTLTTHISLNIYKYIYTRENNSRELYLVNLNTFRDFERAIDSLRYGNIEYYNIIAKNIKIATIKIPDELLMLPGLKDDYTEADLMAYVELAEMQ